MENPSLVAIQVVYRLIENGIFGEGTESEMLVKQLEVLKRLSEPMDKSFLEQLSSLLEVRVDVDKMREAARQNQEKIVEVIRQKISDKADDFTSD